MGFNSGFKGLTECVAPLTPKTSESTLSLAQYAVTLYVGANFTLLVSGSFELFHVGLCRQSNTPVFQIYLTDSGY